MGNKFDKKDIKLTKINEIYNFFVGYRFKDMLFNNKWCPIHVIILIYSSLINYCYFVIYKYCIIKIVK